MSDLRSQIAEGVTIALTSDVPAAATGTTILDMFIPGSPKPKGSLKHVGGGRLVEQVAGSTAWKSRLASVVRMANPGRVAHDGPVAVVATVYVDRPPSAPKSRTYPVTRSSGDSDKHARNILDALSAPSARFPAAGVFRDDSQVVDLTIRKRHSGSRGPGVHVTVSAVAS